MKTTLYFLMSLCILCSCQSTLKIKVDIIDRYSIERSKEYKYFTDCNKRPVNFNDASADTFLTKSFAIKLKTFVLANLDKIIIAQDDLEQLSYDVSAEIVDSLKVSYNNAELKGCNINAVLFRILDNQKKKFNNFIKKAKYGDPNAVISKDKQQNIDIQVDMLANETRQKALEISFGTSIAYDPLASLIAKSPNYYWRKFSKKVDLITLNSEDKSNQPARTNTTIVRTFFGNADIAVKMEAPGYFVVKGVRLDANEAFKTSFKVLNQGIKYMAYSSGIQVPDVAADGSAPGTSSVKLPDLNLKDSLELTRHNLAKNNQLALQAFLNNLFAEASTIESPANDAQIKQALIRIQSNFDIYKTQIK